MMALLKLCLDYVKANPLLGIIAAGLVLLILVFLIVIICVSAKRKKARKRLNAEKAQSAQATTAQAATAQTSTAQQAEQAPQSATIVEPLETAQQPQPQPAPVDAKEAEKARREAAWKEVEAKLEAQRIAAEKEEAEKLAAEKAATQEVATQETEKPVFPKKESAPAKKAATPKKPAKKPAAKVTEKKAEAKTEKPVKAETSVKTETPKAEPKAKAKAPAKPVKANAEENGGKYTGKWVIYRVRTEGEEAEETYYFELRASNGEKLLSSEEYASYSGVLKGIETHKTNIQKGNFRITLSKKGHYIFKILSRKNTLLCTGENYTSLARCESAMESTKRFAKSALLDETLHEQIVKVPVEDDTDVEVILDNGNGKWIISEKKVVDGEPLYYFELFANNGEKLLTSEDYTTYIGAVNGISTHKTNIEKGNFRIALTKKGDYIFKLLNGNGQLLSLGEHYKSKRLCQNAVDSVKRFAKNSPVLTDPSLTKSL